MLVDRHNSMTAASFEPVTPIVLVAQKILQRAEQKCAEPAFLLICATQRIFFKQVREKTLDKILRLRRSVTSTSHKAVKRRPVRFAEIGKRFSRCFRWIRLSSAQHESPVRRLKRRSAFLQCSRYRFHNFVISLSNANAVVNDRSTREENCGARFPPGANAAKIREFLTNSRRCRLTAAAPAKRPCSANQREKFHSAMLWYLTTRAIMTVSFRRFRLRCRPAGRFFRECDRID